MKVALLLLLVIAAVGVLVGIIQYNESSGFYSRWLFIIGYPIYFLIIFSIPALGLGYFIEHRDEVRKEIEKE